MARLANIIDMIYVRNFELEELGGLAAVPRTGGYAELIVACAGSARFSGPDLLRIGDSALHDLVRLPPEFRQ